MKRHDLGRKLMLAGGLLLAPALGFAFNSGSTGADGAFTPAVNTVLQVPESGVFNFTSVNIPTGVTVTFKKNTTNTPVVILSAGDVIVAGKIDVSGARSADVGSGGNGNLGDDGLPGAGGPGGYSGGGGGAPGSTTSMNSGRQGGDGLGPGGGQRGDYYSSSYIVGGGGGGFAVAGYASYSSSGWPGQGGASYGSSLLLPLIGGSGGGGGTGGTAFTGSGGGGGGGALLIAATGTVNVTGSILANGGVSGNSGGSGNGATGGGGSGGAIRIMASTIAGNGTINASAGSQGSGSPWSNGGTGGDGRIRLESDSITRTAGTSPAYTFGAPGTVFVAGLPTLTINSVAGVNAPAQPTGNADITLPSTTANPVTVVFQTANVPVGNTIKLTVTPSAGTPTVVVSPALTGTTASATASVTVTLPTGASTLQAQTTYTIVAALGDALSTYANNERVEKVTVIAGLGKPTVVKLITVSGKEFDAPAALFAHAG